MNIVPVVLKKLGKEHETFELVECVAIPSTGDKIFDEVSDTLYQVESVGFQLMNHSKSEAGNRMCSPVVYLEAVARKREKKGPNPE
jgi:hypothetical protein